MAAIYLARRGSRASPKHYLQFAAAAASFTPLSYFSAASKSTQGSRSVAERTGKSENATAMHESNQQGFTAVEDDSPGNTTSFMAKEGVKRATEMAENIGDAAKVTTDITWEAAKNAAEGIKESVVGSKGDDEIEENAIDELRKKAGGYDLPHNNK